MALELPRASLPHGDPDCRSTDQSDPSTATPPPRAQPDESAKHDETQGGQHDEVSRGLMKDVIAKSIDQVEEGGEGKRVGVGEVENGSIGGDFELARL